MTPCKSSKRTESPYLGLLNKYKQNIHKLSNVYKLSKEREFLKEYNLIFLGLNRAFILRTTKELWNLKIKHIDPS